MFLFFQWLFRLDLKLFTVLEFTTSLERLFQGEITLFANACFLMFNLQCFFFNLYPWPLVLPVLSNSNSCSLSAWSMSLSILYVSTISDRNLRYSSDGKPRVRNLSLYCRCDRGHCVTILSLSPNLLHDYTYA